MVMGYIFFDLVDLAIDEDERSADLIEHLVLRLQEIEQPQVLLVAQKMRLYQRLVVGLR
jgi:hypothetical protein